MQNPFVSQPGLFVTTSDLEQLAPHALDATEEVLGWSKLEPILSSIYASKTSRPSCSLLTFFTVFCWEYGTGYRTFNCHNVFIVTFCFEIFATLN